MLTSVFFTTFLPVVRIYKSVAVSKLCHGAGQGAANTSNL